MKDRKELGTKSWEKEQRYCTKSDNGGLSEVLQWEKERSLPEWEQKLL